MTGSAPAQLDPGPARGVATDDDVPDPDAPGRPTARPPDCPSARPSVPVSPQPPRDKRRLDATPHT